MYKIRFTKSFIKKLEKLIKRNPTLGNIIDKVFKQISLDPFLPSLKTHKVDAKDYGLVYSSRITGDLRLIWSFIDKNTLLIALDIGGHSGKNKVYK